MIPVDLVMEWVGRVLNYEDTMDDVRDEMREWVDRDADRLWALATASVSCVAFATLDAAESAGQLVVAREDDWILETISGPGWQNPDVVAAVQASTAALNRDDDMMNDLLIAHRRAGGPAALFRLAVVACGMVHALKTPGQHSVGSWSDGP